MVETRNLDILEHIIEREIERSKNLTFFSFKSMQPKISSSMESKYSSLKGKYYSIDTPKSNLISANITKPISQQEFEKTLSTDKTLNSDPVAKIDFMIDFLFKKKL
jgi:hypothetical protein